jgi:hypothetical protein
MDAASSHGIYILEATGEACRSMTNIPVLTSQIDHHLTLDQVRRP